MGRFFRACLSAFAVFSVAAAIALLPVDLHAHTGLETQASCSTCAVKSHSPGALTAAAPDADPARIGTPVDAAPVEQPEPVTVAPSHSRAPPEA